MNEIITLDWLLLNAVGLEIGVDIDNTLTVGDVALSDFLDITPKQYIERIKTANPNYEIIGKVNLLYEKNFVGLFTSRPQFTFKATVNWLEEVGVLYHHLIMGKPHFNYFVDDKAVNPFLKLFEGKEYEK